MAMTGPSARFFDFPDKDVLQPEIMEIDGIFFRVNPIFGDGVAPQTSYSSISDAPFSDVLDDFSPEELDVLQNRMTKKAEDGTFRLILDKECIPSSLFPILIGKGGAAKKAIEDETKARITIPERKDQDRDKPIEIYSYDDIQLIICRRKLLSSAHAARMKMPFTHFVCFPVATEVTVRKFEEFRLGVIRKCAAVFTSDRLLHLLQNSEEAEPEQSTDDQFFTDEKAKGFSDGLFQLPRKLHVTIGTLALYNTREYNIASEELDECVASCLRKLLDEGPLTCHIKGLEIMNDDPGEVDVLYGMVDDSTGRIQKLANKIYRHYLRGEPRFLQDRFGDLEYVKLHVTLMNSRFRKGMEVGEDEMSGVPSQDKKKVTFDATEILRLFKDFDFGSCPVNEVHISQRYSTGENSFYKATRKLILSAALFKGRNQEDLASEYDVASPEYGDEPNCD